MDFQMASFAHELGLIDKDYPMRQYILVSHGVQFATIGGGRLICARVAIVQP